MSMDDKSGQAASAVRGSSLPCGSGPEGQTSTHTPLMSPQNLFIPSLYPVSPSSFLLCTHRYSRLSALGVSISLPPFVAASSVSPLHQSPTLVRAPRMCLPFLPTVIHSTVQSLTRKTDFTHAGWLRDILEPQTFTDVHNMLTNRAALASTSVGEPQPRHTGAGTGTRAVAAHMEWEAPQEAANGPSGGGHAGRKKRAAL